MKSAMGAGVGAGMGAGMGAPFRSANTDELIVFAMLWNCFVALRAAL